MKPITSFLLLASLSAAFSTLAVQKDITITADIDHMVNLTKVDGSALPDSIRMEYLPGANKLKEYEEQVKIWSNSFSNINIRLAQTAELFNRDSQNRIPLTVRLDGKPLSTSNMEIAYSTLFNSGDLSAGSKPLTLDILQEATSTASPLSTSGRYSGVVSIIVTQATAT